jgi:hypothetical protein
MRGEFDIPLNSPAVVILAWQQGSLALAVDWRQFLNVAQFFGDNAGTNIDVFHLREA